jgi:hypothetical protein
MTVSCHVVVFVNAVAAVVHAVSAIVVVLLVVLQPEQSPDIVYPLIWSMCEWRPALHAEDQMRPHVMFQGFRIEPHIQRAGVRGCFVWDRCVVWVGSGKQK